MPVLQLGLDCYDRMYTIIDYEGGFIPNRPYCSAYGVFHTRGPGLSGEVWLHGPLILSWEVGSGKCNWCPCEC